MANNILQLIEKRWLYNGAPFSDGNTFETSFKKNGSNSSYRPQSEQQQYREPCAFCKQWGTQATRTLGVGTALKPAHEPICLARKPLSEKSVAENCLKWGTGGINIDGSRIGNELIFIRGGGEYTKSGEKTFFPSKSINEFRGGRFPANFIHDGSDEVMEEFDKARIS